MLSYRHAFHAGNHADVLKHFVQMQLHEYLNQKDVAYTYVDTHSGAGVYSLDGKDALKTGEFETGIARLWERKDLPAPLAAYVQLIKDMNPSGKLRLYPGSPYVADQCTRPEDRLRLFELHPADGRILHANFGKLEAHAAEQGVRSPVRGKRVMITQGDGFQGLKALLPPPSRRALVLIDPPYEVKDDYKRVRDTLQDALHRFPTGTYAVWYPVLQRVEARHFADRLKTLPCKEWLNVSLSICQATPDGIGLHSSGMFILNPPYTLLPMLKEVMPYLLEALRADEGASFVLESGVPLPAGKMAASAARPTAAAPRPARPGTPGAGRPGAPVAPRTGSLRGPVARPSMRSTAAARSGKKITSK